MRLNRLLNAGLGTKILLYYIVSIGKYVLRPKQRACSGFLQKLRLPPWGWVT